MKRSIAAVTVSAAIATLGLASSPSVAAPRADSTFRFVGSGWGHGVGMSQWGAYQQAMVGRDAKTIVRSYYPGATLSSLDDSRILRVNIGYRLRSAKLRSVPLAAGGGRLSIVVPGTKPVTGPPGSVVEVSGSGTQVVGKLFRPGLPTVSFSGLSVVVQWAGTRARGRNGVVPTAVELAKNGGSYRTSARYRYGQVAVTSASSELAVVNLVRIRDEYLPGIAEVSAGWPLQAQMAQAVAARSYALSKTSIRSVCRCHSDDGSGPYFDQTFIGYARATSYLGARWVAAVQATQSDATTGWALTHGGVPIPAFYYSSSGGRTSNSEDVWGGYLPWARSVADPWSVQATANPNRQWSFTRSSATVASVFGLPNIADVSVTARYASGQVRSIQGRSESGVVKVLSGTSFASRLGLRSTWINGIEKV